MKVISILGDDNCLFRAISYGFYGTQDKHQQVRSSVVDCISDDWNTYKNFIIGDAGYGENIQSASDYRNVMSTIRQRAGHAELHSLSVLFPECLFRIYYENSETIKLQVTVLEILFIIYFLVERV